MGGAALVDVDRQLGPALDQAAGGGCVVEVDVGEEDGARLEVLAERAEDGVEGRLGAGVDEGAVDLPAADRVGVAELECVDRAHGRGAY